MTRPRSRLRLLPLSAFLVLFVSGCSSPPAQPDSVRSGTITVASFDFPESELLAAIYAQALEANGYPVRLMLDVGSREIVEPSLAAGLVQFVPEYAGSALDFVSAGGSTGSSDPLTTHAELLRVLQRYGLTALAPAPAQNANGIVVTQDTATKRGLRTVSDLAGVKSRLVLGGPQECPERPFCLLGLRRTYGVSLDFVPLDTGGPLTLEALRARQIDVALLFTTDPSLRQGDLVLLRDDRGLQPAENVTPVVRRDVVARYGQRFVDLVDSISSSLSTDGLRALNQQVGTGGASATAVAGAWLRAQGLFG